MYKEMRRRIRASQYFSPWLIKSVMGLPIQRMNKETFMRYGVPLAAVAASIGIGFAGISAADTTSTTAPTSAPSGMHRGMPGVFGKVTAISGTTLTVASTNPGKNSSSSTTTYTVDASSAKVMKGVAAATPATSSVSAIAVGDSVMIRGTVSGTSVTATDIMDGLLGQGMPMMGGHGGPGMGRGQGVNGTVTAVSGSTITLTGKDGKTYTVDASSAQLDKVSTITAAQVAVGDALSVDGTVSGTTVTAKHVMDGMPTAPQQ